MAVTLRVGIGGPVGSGKTQLALRLCQRFRDVLNMAVITNDIYTREDAEFLTRHAALAPDRILAVETGCCPHAAVRDDISMNIEAVEVLERRHGTLALLLIESGGDNLSASFSPDLVERQIYVIDVAGGDKVPRKGGPGILKSDLLVINKIDLADHVGASLAVMADDSARVRGRRPVVFSDLRHEVGIDTIGEHLLAWMRAAKQIDVAVSEAHSQIKAYFS